jgi:hypothetical protein
MSDGATTLKGKLTIGLAYIATIALTVWGGIALRGPINVITVAGVASGAVLQTNGVTNVGYVTRPLTMTGGLAAYHLSDVKNPLGSSNSGAILGVYIQWIRAPKVIQYDVGFTKCAGTASGSTFSGLNNISSGTGSFKTFVAGSGGLAVPRWNSADCVTVQSLTSGGPTASGSGYITVQYMDDMSE